MTPQSLQPTIAPRFTCSSLSSFGITFDIRCHASFFEIRLDLNEIEHEFLADRPAGVLLIHPVGYRQRRMLTSRPKHDAVVGYREVVLPIESIAGMARSATGKGVVERLCGLDLKTSWVESTLC